MPARSVYLETFGCQMNELDSELVQGQLRALGYRFTSDPAHAQVILYNTCSVREHAEQKVWSRLGELALRKKSEPALVVGVLGCLAERDGAALIKRMPVVDILCGPAELDKLPSLLDNAVRTRQSLLADDPEVSTRDGAEVARAKPDAVPTRHLGTWTPRHLSLVSANQVALQGSSSRRSATLAAAQDSLELLDLSRSISAFDDAAAPRRSAYVRITRGCNKFCTYCVVPFTRGAETHRPPAHIIDECKRLADAGIIEITLLGQTVNHYRFEHSAAITVNGLTQPQKGRSYTGGHRRDPFAGKRTTTFADLLAAIHDRVPAIQRLRFVTSYPRDFGDDVLEAIRDHPRICRYLHAPVQSGSDRILGAMNRGYAAAEYLEFLDRARSFLDQPASGRPLMISGDIIVGFPGETEDDFDATAALLERARYKNCFIFKYSPRPGTVAHDRLADDVPEQTKRRRNNALLAIQARISDQISQAQVGRTFDCLVEGLSRRATAAGEPLTTRGPLAAGGAGVPPAVRATRTIPLTIRATSNGHRGGSACAPDLEQRPQPSAPAATPDTLQLSARTDGDLIVFLQAPAASAHALIGRILPIRIDSAHHLALHGRML
jgi:tRNA-2-methylthio-N6-dimethylallyladenosine synthase